MSNQCSIFQLNLIIHFKLVLIIFIYVLFKFERLKITIKRYEHGSFLCVATLQRIRFFRNSHEIWKTRPIVTVGIYCSKLLRSKERRMMMKMMAARLYQGLRTAAHQKGFILFFLCFTAFVIFTFSMCVVVVAAVPVSGEKICLT